MFIVFVGDGFVLDQGFIAAVAFLLGVCILLLSAEASPHAEMLQGRVRIEAGDIRQKAPDESFNIVTLYNNIYYFPVEKRMSLLQHVRRFIKPDGVLLLITCCEGGSLGVEVLNLWGAATSSCGRLPSKQELIGQLHDAGFQDVQTIRLIPGEALFAFQAMPGRKA